MRDRKAPNPTRFDEPLARTCVAESRVATVALEQGLCDVAREVWAASLERSVRCSQQRSVQRSREKSEQTRRSAGRVAQPLLRKYDNAGGSLWMPDSPKLLWKRS